MQNRIQPTNYRMARLILGMGLGLALGLGSGLAQDGLTWQTTHTSNGGFNRGIASLVRNEARVTVYPGYLDVEEEMEFSAQGTVSQGNDPATLEIVASLKLSPEATMVGGLLWFGDTLLGAKLLSRSKADSLYELHVERNSVPPVRAIDPMIIESLGGGGYRMRVYPLKLGETRRLRLRYHVPAAVGPQGVFLPLRTAFTGNFGPLRQLTVHLDAGPGVSECGLNLSSGARTVTLPRSLLLTDELHSALSAEDGRHAPSGHAVGLIFIQPGEAAGQTLARTSIDEGNMTGHYVHVHALVPPTLLGKARDIQETSPFGTAVLPLIMATVSNGKHAYDIQASCQDQPLQCQPLVFQGKSPSPWKAKILWTVYDASGQAAATQEQSPKLMDRIKDTSLAVLWAGSTSPFSETREPPLGPVYGFIDGWASLLALEKDALDSATQAFYANSGVPRIANRDIQNVLPNYSQDLAPKPTNPTNPTVPDDVRTTRIRLHPYAAGKAGLTWKRLGDHRITLQLPQTPSVGEAKAAMGFLQILRPDGKAVRAQPWAMNQQGQIILSLTGIKPGLYFLRVKTGGRLFTTTLVWN